MVFLAGCSAAPSAPPLTNGEATYRDAQEGFRFEVPAGWRQHTRAAYPPGQYPKERTLVKFARLDSSHPAIIRASMMDFAPGMDEGAYLSERPGGPEKWQLAPETKALSVNGLAGKRFTFTGHWEGENLIKEVVALRRGERVYFFTGIFPAADNKVREVIRKTVASIAWEAQTKK